MLIGLISDVHANLPALQAVLDKLENCDEIYCCGDIVGYYPYPNEVIEMLRDYEINSVLGNHDYSVLTGDVSGYNYVAETTLRWTISHIKDENIEFLSELPFSISTNYFSVYHGKPGEGLEVLFEYIFPEYLNDVSFDENVVIGHTHIQFVKWFDDKFVLNPGSVGQPRDGDSRAAYAVFDSECFKIKLKRTNYNIDEVCDAVDKAGLPTYLCDRLYMGV